MRARLRLFYATNIKSNAQRTTREILYVFGDQSIDDVVLGRLDVVLGQR